MIITRFHNIEKMEIEVEFLTPAFLGGADQNAELRSAPFKNLLRQWWRVANCNSGLSAKELLEQEGKLFGNVFKDKNAKENSVASSVRLSIINPAVSYYKEKSLLFKTIGMPHPEVKNKFMPLEVYLGMGPVFFNSETKTNEYKRSAILPGSKCTLCLHYPKFKYSILETLALIKEFGCIGSRSRNGWGSLDVKAPEIPPLPDKFACFDTVIADGKKYPHALCSSNGNLLAWETLPQKDYVSAWHLLAQTYMQIRTQPVMKEFGDIAVKDKDKPEFLAHKHASARHLLGYPITHHKINDETWGENRNNFNLPKKIEGRLASPLRLAIKKSGDGFVGRILHLPYSVHMNFPGNQQQVWQQIHRFLDTQQQFRRIGGGV